MKFPSLLVFSTVIVSPVFAEDARQLGSHEHGVGQLDIAIDGSQVAMELHAPGADIVGFEYAVESDEDVTAVDSALMVLASPLELFVVPDAARCSVLEARAELESEDEHDDNEGEGHDEHESEDHDNHGHDEHEGEEHDDHGHDEHEGEDHDYGDEDHAHDEHEGEEYGEGAGHTEFHAEYLLECGDITALTEMSFAYFDAFTSALEVEVQVLSEAGATAFEVERDAPMLDLSDVN